MATIREVLNNVKSFNLTNAAMDVVSENKERFIELNKEQMLAGKNRLGQDLPLYVNDPYFKSVSAALRYQKWKRAISPNKDKPEGVMDFFINGKYHSSLGINISGNSFTLLSNSQINSSVYQKTGGKHLGLNDVTKQIAVDEFFYDELLSKVHEGMKL